LGYDTNEQYISYITALFGKRILRNLHIHQKKGGIHEIYR